MSAPEEHAPPSEDLYDLLLRYPPHSAPRWPETERQWLADALQHPLHVGWDPPLAPRIIPLGQPCATIVIYNRALRAAGGRGEIVPVRYRHPRISIDEGRVRAEAEFETRRTPGKAYMAIALSGASARCWRYFARVVEEGAQRRIPGGLSIFIDKWDGHVVSWDEYVSPDVPCSE